MISLVIFALAAFFNACMDAFENENFHESVFKNWNQKFWYKRESWKYAKVIPFTKYKLDAWHISKTLMVISAAIAIIVGYNWDMNWMLKLPLLGGIWITTFNFVYHKVFKIK